MSRQEFSVSMCVYGKDNPEYFDLAINSVVDQTVKPTEIVVTVDGPIPDSIGTVLEKYRKALNETSISFKVVRLEKNMGHGEARRVCFDNCSCSIIALMDADDISSSDRFEKELSAFNDDPNLTIVGSHVSEFTDSPDKVLSKRMVKLDDYGIKMDMKHRCPMNQPTVMFKKIDVNEVGGYIDWFCNEDYYLWIRLALANKRFKNIDDCLVAMRVDDNLYQRRGGIRYFRSEAKIQKLMLDKKMISASMFIMNCGKRFIVQVLLPNSLRGWIFKKFARQKI